MPGGAPALGLGERRQADADVGQRLGGRATEAEQDNGTEHRIAASPDDQVDAPPASVLCSTAARRPGLVRIIRSWPDLWCAGRGQGGEGKSGS
jgi:hypothetical protein